MIALAFQLLGGFRGLIVGAVAAALTFGAVSIGHKIFVHPGIHRDGVAEGKQTERAAWETQMAVLRAALEAERLKAQAKIDTAELQYLEQRDRDVSRIQALEAAIAQEPTDDKTCPDRPAISGGVSTQLNKIGR